MNIGIASDHRGFELKQKLTQSLVGKGYNVINYGTDSLDNVDYIDFALKIGEGINGGNINYGIVICGTGIGMSIACNKIKGLRCAKVNAKRDAELSRRDVDANVIALDETIDLNSAIEFAETFINTIFNPIERYVRRIEKIQQLERKI